MFARVAGGTPGADDDSESEDVVDIRDSFVLPEHLRKQNMLRVVFIVTSAVSKTCRFNT